MSVKGLKATDGRIGAWRIERMVGRYRPVFRRILFYQSIPAGFVVCILL